MTSTDAKLKTQPKPLVVFIHGIAASRFVFLYLQYYLWRNGFRTKLFGYRSVWKTIPGHAQRFSELLERLENDPAVVEFHIVAHSMGGVVARQALLENRPGKLKRFLMLATPNKGSAAARKLSQGLFRFSKTLAQISDAEDSYVRQLASLADIEMGAIHAEVDRVVSRESCFSVPDLVSLEIYSGHNDLLIRPATARAALQFLKTGSFAASANPATAPAELGHS